MKSGLQRIEATLNQLHAQNVTSESVPSTEKSVGRLVLKSQTPTSLSTRIGTCSFDVRAIPPQGELLRIAHSPNPSNNLVESFAVRPFPVQEHCPQPPNLPKFKLPSFSSHRHAANPGFAMGLLKEMEAIVSTWQTELQQILMNIQELYLEGPIVDGWLESESRDSREILQQVKNVQQAKNVQQTNSSILATAPDSTHKSYRLCGLDANGQPWCRPCPTDQLPHISRAIARYQKLRQLLGRQQELESRLSHIAQDLMAVHSKLR